VLWGWLIAAALLALAQTYLGPWVARLVEELLDRGAQSDAQVIGEFPNSESRTETCDGLRRLSASRAKAKVSRLDVMPVTCEKLPLRHEPGSAAMAAILTGAKQITDFFLSVPSHRMVMLGPPGSGKTILAWRIVLELINNHPEERLIPLSFL
jgi:DNA replication protein DnaC